jgi:O-antigen/teichoic acid export membrane protein
VTDDSPLLDSDRRRSLARVAGNSGWNLIAFLVGIIANLLALPFVIHRIGIFQFGICGLFIAIATPLSLVGTILGLSTAQGIARFGSQRDRVAIAEFCSTIIAIGLVSIAATGTLLVLISPPIARILYPRYEPMVHSIWLVSITLGCGWMAQQLSLLMQGVHVACQAYRRIATINGLGAIGGPVLIFVIVSGRPDVEGYILALALGYALTALFWLISTAASFSWCLVRPQVHRTMTRLIGAFTGWQLLAQLAGNVATQVDRYLLGSWVSPNAVGYYNISQRLEEVAYIGVLRAGEALFPQFSVNASENLQRQADIFFRASWMLNLVAAIVMAPLLPWAPSLLLVWVGPGSSVYSVPVLQLLTVGGLLGCAGNVFGLYALGVAKTRYTALLSVVAAVTTGITSTLVLRKFGFPAAGVGGVVGMVVNLGLICVLIRRHFGAHAERGRIFAAILMPIGVALTIGGGLAVIGVPIQTTWLRVIIGYAATSSIIALAVVILTGLTRHGQSSLSDLRRLARLPLTWAGSLLKSGTGS